jgi:hypothetical protein
VFAVIRSLHTAQAVTRAKEVNKEVWNLVKAMGKTIVNRKCLKVGGQMNK